MNTRFFGILVSAIICCYGIVSAQISLKTGLVTGYSSYTQKLEHSIFHVKNIIRRTGIVAGAVCDISVSKVLSIEPGIFYSKRGARVEGDITIDCPIITENCSYFAIPLHVKMKYPFPVINPYALAGFNIGILLEAKDFVEGGDMPSEEIDATHDLNSTDFGLDFGGGVQLDIFKFTPFVEFVYFLGLSELKKDSRYNSFKNIGWEIKTGLKFRIY